MIKRTLYFGSPVGLTMKNKQLVVEFLNEEKAPVKDIGLLMLDHYQISISHALISALQANNSIIISCDEKHHPLGMMLPLWINSEFTEKLRMQIAVSLPLKKQLWQQTVVAKIRNQAALLKKRGIKADNMETWARKVRSGDPENFEARAAAYYWEHIFYEKNFRRHRFGEAPNNLLNYAYAILRAVLARSLVSSGLLPALGIHHSNRYNPFCLVDDVMEPYRPLVDELVIEILENETDIEQLNPALKKKLLQVPVLDVEINNKKSPLMVGAQQTSSSLIQCFEGKSKKIKYPLLKAYSIRDSKCRET
jgi:CRISP-associated protein Cas1